MSPERPAKPPVPTSVTIVVVLVAVALVVGAFFLGRYLAGDASGEPTEVATLPLAAPDAIGAFQLAESSSPSTAADVGKELVRATYTDGSDRVLLVLSRPETELGEFLVAAGIEELGEVEGSEASPGATSITLCGRSADTGNAACGRLAQGAGELLVGLTEVPSEQLSTMLDELHRQ